MLAPSAEAIAWANIDGRLQVGLGTGPTVQPGTLRKSPYLLLQVPLDDVREGVITFLA